MVVLQKTAENSKQAGWYKTVDIELRSEAKQLCNKLNLSLDIACFNSLNLPFPYHVHGLVTLNRPLGRWV